MSSAREDLAERGILYPKLGTHSHQTQLIFSFLDDEEFPRDFGRSSDAGVEKSVQRAEQLWEKLENLISDGDYHTLILSSEYAFGMRPLSWKRMADKLRTIAAELHLVGYYRSPASHYKSGQQQVLKFGCQIESPFRLLNYKSNVVKLREHAKPDSLYVGQFGVASLKNGNIVDDFVAWLDDIGGYGIGPLETKNTNESLSAETVRVLYDFNKRLFPDRRIPGNDTSKILLEALARAETRVSSTTKLELRPEIMDAVDAAHKKDVEWLRDEMGLLFEDYNFEAKTALSDEVQHRVEAGTLTPDDIFKPINPSDVRAIKVELLKDLIDQVLEVRGQSGTPVPPPHADKLDARVSSLTDAIFPPQEQMPLSLLNYRRTLQKGLIDRSESWDEEAALLDVMVPMLTTIRQGSR